MRPLLVLMLAQMLVEAFFVDPVLRAFLIAILPVAIVFFQHNSAMPLFLVHNLKMSEANYGMLFSLNAATSHWSHRRALALGSMLFAVGFGALAGPSAK